ncbi:hypothetical protein N9Y72_00625 [Gammaproteobacteria bacterium]|jgi:hypothetical protein|nr:hypothetical protein [Gammaproteobacteria bacterium]MDB2318854.1 hypothetical protein [Gammaproteobacteria bacterium]MDB2628541.1 hypothetical protein [Gammaproteobacteria bacterium]MDC1012951.1 hypothetical protein [Gammaproteobacteria bacterium]
MKTKLNVAAMLAVLIPAPFLEYFPNNPIIGRLAIPLWQKADGTMQTLFWLDFLLFALVIALVTKFFIKQS